MGMAGLKYIPVGFRPPRCAICLTGGVVDKFLYTVHGVYCSVECKELGWKSYVEAHEWLRQKRNKDDDQD